MDHLKNKTIREFNEKNQWDKLKQLPADLFERRIESKKRTLRKESGKLKPLRKDIARMMTRLTELKKYDTHKKFNCNNRKFVNL